MRSSCAISRGDIDGARSALERAPAIPEQGHCWAPNEQSREENGWGGRIPCFSIALFCFPAAGSKLGHFRGHFSGWVQAVLGRGTSSIPAIRVERVPPLSVESWLPLRGHPGSPSSPNRGTHLPPLSQLIRIASGSWARTSEIRSGFLTETVSLDVLEQDLHQYGHWCSP